MRTVQSAILVALTLSIPAGLISYNLTYSPVDNIPSEIPTTEDIGTVPRENTGSGVIRIPTSNTRSTPEINRTRVSTIVPTTSRVETEQVTELSPTPTSEPTQTPSPSPTEIRTTITLPPLCQSKLSCPPS